jgi:hypothetical protein
MMFTVPVAAGANNGMQIGLRREGSSEVISSIKWAFNDLSGGLGNYVSINTGLTDLETLKCDSAQNVTVSAGNLVIGTSGKGIDFSATPGTGTSELLADYEEGTWTPVPVPTLGAITTYTSSGIYTKVGRQVTLTFTISISNAGTAVALSSITGIPFTNGGEVAPGCGREAGVTGAMWQYLIGSSATSISGRAYTNDPSIGNGYILYGSITYTV